MTKQYPLYIYEADARTIKRRTVHTSRAARARSLRDYERRHGRHCNAFGEPVEID